MAQTIQLRRGTSAEWTSVNPVLAAGEPGFELGTGKLKIGNGVTKWNSLGYTTNVDIIGDVVGNVTGNVEGNLTGNVTGNLIGGLATITKTGNYTALATDQVIVCNRSTEMTVTLPAATGSGKTFNIKSVNYGPVIVDAYGSQTIDGELTQEVEQWENLVVIDYAAGAWGIL